ncbi:hypothetical protein [Elongatibacter sediminis]|uniref:Uncharacterized protein n=1 Tax=Elongatibacter sediminis TaxID=3119006 RepID=A0AAW9RK46_9GAMM
MPAVRLLLISRDDILRDVERGEAEPLFRRLAGLTRQGFHLLATAPQPEKWSGEHGSPDDALLGPDSIRKRLLDVGGKLDGVYYVRRSLLTQKRNRQDALNDMLERYGASPGNCTLLSSKRKYMQTAIEMGINGIQLSRDLRLLEALAGFGEEPDNPTRDS